MDRIEEFLKIIEALIFMPPDSMKEFDKAVERACELGTPLPQIDPKYDEGFVIPGYFRGGHIGSDPNANYKPEWVIRYIHFKAASLNGANGMFSLKPGDKILGGKNELYTFIHYVVAQNGWHRFRELVIYMRDAEGHEWCLDEDDFHFYQAVSA